MRYHSRGHHFEEKHPPATNLLRTIRQKACADPKRIVFPESTDERTLHAVERIRQEGIAIPILIGKPDVRNKAKDLHINLDGIPVINPENSEHTDPFAKEFYELRKHKGISEDDARSTILDPIYFATMMVQMDKADGMVSGAQHTTAQTVRPALQIIKTKEQYHKVSGLFLMVLDQTYLFADCAIIPNPTAQDLAEIAIDSASSARRFGMEPRVAMLSYSTKDSADNAETDIVQEATEIVRQKYPELEIDGEMQVDAALVQEIRNKKCKDCNLRQNANVLIFPNLSAGNIAYKLVERLAKAKAIGPILQGLNKPVNDLSRGCSVQDIVDVTAITVVEAQGETW